MPAEDLFDDTRPSLTAPASDAFVISPSDTQDLIYVTRSLYVGEGGDVSVVLRSGRMVTFRNVPSGSLLPCFIRRVRSTATTAGDLIGLV